MYKMTKFRLRFILFSHLSPLHNISQNAVILPLSVILPAKDKRRGQKNGFIFLEVPTEIYFHRHCVENESVFPSA